jgi:hypothetical protein
MGYTLTQINTILSKADRAIHILGSVAYNKKFAELDETYWYDRDIIFLYKYAVEWGKVNDRVGTARMDFIVERLEAMMEIYDYGSLTPIYSQVAQVTGINTVNFLTEETDPTVPAWVKLITESDIDNWDESYTDRINSLTTIGSSGTATLINNILNIPNYGSALSAYVPYTGATGDVNLGVYTLNANSINIIGPGIGGNGGGYLGLKQSASVIYGGGGYTSLNGEDKIYLTMYFSQDLTGTNYKLAKFNVSALTNNTPRIYSLPNTSGTLALTSDITNLTFSSPLVNTAGVVSIPAATSSVNGYLSSADWTTFNNKQAAGNYVTLDTYQTITASKTFSVGLSLASAGGTNQLTSFVNTDSIHSGSAGSNILGFNNSNNIYFGKGSDNGGIISWNNSEVRYYTLPNANGTIALVGGSGVGTVTSIATTGPITGGTITSTGTIGITQATASTDGYLSSTDWNTFNSKQGALTLTTTGTSGAATLVGTTLNIPQYTEQFVGTVTSVAASITGNSIGITGSPITSSGTLAFAFAGNATQYVRGDGALATLPTNGGGGGASVSYYLNGSINQGTIGGVTYYEMNKTPIIGAGTDFSRNTNGYIASFLTDANDPALLNIPAGNFNFETYFEASSGGGSPTFYIELYKYDGTTFTLIASNSTSPKLINDGTNIEAYFSALAVPQTTLTLTDRLAIRIYVTTAGRTITLHTENGHLCQVITTFTTGLTALNGLTAQVQYLATGTSGTDFNISSATATHTFNLPTASATNRGALSSSDWSVFNAKQNALTLTTTGTSGAATLVGATLNIPQYTDQFVGTVTSVAALTLGTSGTDLSSTVANSTTTPVITLNVPTASATNRGALSSADWTTFNNKQNALTNPITGTGTSGQVAYWNGTSSITGESNLFWDATNDRLGINTNTPSTSLHIVRNDNNYNSQLLIDNPNSGTQAISYFTLRTNSVEGGGVAYYGSNYTNAQQRSSVILYSLPNTKLGIVANAQAIGSNQDIYFATKLANTNLQIFGTSGNVLIQNGGTFTDAGFRLDVNGTARVQGQTIIKNAADAENIKLENRSIDFSRNGGAYGGSSISSTGNAMSLFSRGAMSFLAGGSGLTIFQLNDESTGVNTGIARITPSIGLSSGTAPVTTLLLRPTNNFTGTYSGIVRGLLYDPINTSLTGVTHRAIETVTGDVLLCTTSGNVAIGTSTLATATELTLGGSQTASSAIARGGLINTTLVAAANNDVLVGLDINPTFTNGAFTGVSNIALRTVGSGRIDFNNLLKILPNGGAGGNAYIYTEGSSVLIIQGQLGTNIGWNNNANTTWSTTIGNGASRTAILGLFKSDNVEIGRVFNTGNVLLQNGGTFTDAGFRLDVNGTARIGSSTTNPAVNLLTLTSSASAVTLRAGGGTDLVLNGSLSTQNNCRTTDYFQGQRILLGNGNARLAGGTVNWLDVQNTSSVAAAGNLSANFGTFGVAYASINASAQLQVDSTVRGFLPPRQTQTQRNAIASPAEGLIVYQTDGVAGLYVYSGGSWKSLTMTTI